MEKFLSKVGRIFNFTYGIVEIDDVHYELSNNESAYLKKCLTPIEHEVFSRFPVLKRKTEWLGGRLAAKQAFWQYQERYGNSEPLNTISILNDLNRAPYIDGYNELTLSISHAGDYAVAVLAQYPIGVDIEMISTRPRSFSDYFLCVEEQHIIQNVADQSEKKTADLLTYFWTRKEAVAKVLKMGCSLNFKDINTCQNIAIINTGAIKSGMIIYSETNDYEIQLYSWCSDKCYLSLAINT